MEDGGLHDGQGDNIRILINLSGVCGTSIRISTGYHSKPERPKMSGFLKL